MTEKQTSWYWRLWRDACKANGWHMQQCRLQNAEPTTDKSDVAVTVLATAKRLAAAQHRAPGLDDVRHAVHFVAVHRDCGHDQIKPKEFGRLRPLLLLLKNPDDLAAMNEWLHPELDELRQLKAAINVMPQSYVQEISLDQFDTRDWENLAIEDLRKLARTVSNRARSHRTSNQPF